MKVAFLFGSLNRGGLETLLLDICQKLQEKDFEAIAVYRKDGVLQGEFLKTNVSFTYLPVRKNILAYLLKLRKYFQHNKVEIVHAQQYLDAIFAYAASLGTKRKIVLSVHGFDFDGESRLLNFILKKTDVNIYVSEYQREYYTEKYKLKLNKQHVIYNGIDFSKINKTNIETTDKLRKELDINKSTLLMGMVGNFNFVRNQFFVCRFLNALKETKTDFHFVFVGKRIENTAQRYDACVNFCEENGLMENVSFLGIRDDVPDILSRLDAFIYATEHDTFGIAVVEAIASGIPVFVNDWDVMNEICENGRFANLYKTNDEKDLL
ncbi:MAG: glycosyltransferase family 4 protein [Paludibacteraceae bacterium]